MLQPTHWVFVYLHDFPGIDDGLISFRSVGNKFYKELEKLVKVESAVCTELRFRVGSQDVYFEKTKKTAYYPEFDLVGRNYRLTDGRVVLLKDSGLDTETLKEILTRSHKVQEDYKNLRLVASRNVTALTGTELRKALPAGQGAYEEDEDDDEQVAF